MEEVVDITPDAVFEAAVEFTRTTGKYPQKLNVSIEAERSLKDQLLAHICPFKAKESGDTFMGLPLVRCDFGWYVS